MRRLHLSTLLIGVNVALLLLAVAGVAVVAVGLLGQLADEQALARVSQAGTSARQAVGRSETDVRVAAQLLAERPTLLRLLAEDDTAALSDFLEQFRQTSEIDGALVLRAGRAFAHSDGEIDWTAVVAAPGQPDTDQADVVYIESDGGLLLSAWATVASLPEAQVIAVQRLDASFAAQISQQVRLPVSIINPAGAAAPGPRASLRAQVLSQATAASARLRQPALYLSVEPLLDKGGRPAGLIETELAGNDIAQSLRQLVQTLLLLTLALAGLAGVAGLLVSRRLSQPLGTLTNAAAQIGRGDLTTPVPALGGAEIGTLADSLEEMRHRLLRLTADLQRQQAEAQAIITGITEGVFTVDRDRRIRFLNPQAAALLGISAEAAIGRFCGDVLNPQLRDGSRPCAEHCPIVHARFRGSTRATEHIQPADGRRTVVITCAAPSEGQQVLVLRDETEVEATRRLRDAMFANISHEFRTPLSAQLASIELLLDRLPEISTEQASQLVLALQRGTLRLTQLIDNLLESVRIEAGPLSIRRRPVALDDVIEDALALTQPLLDQRQQDVQVELPYPLPQVIGDGTRLTQVFVNLLANANKFAPPGSTIRVGCELRVGDVCLWVEDQGPGLPASDGPALFERFFRAAAAEPEQSGMGLGLWIVKSIVEQHGGHVAAQSSPAGTRMCVVLPQEQPQ